MINTYPDFLTPDECKQFIQMIDQKRIKYVSPDKTNKKTNKKQIKNKIK